MSVVLLVTAGYFGGRHLWAGHHLRAARECAERRDFQGASAHLSACLAVWPDDGPTHLLAARCARRDNRYDEAEDHLRHCQALQGLTSDITLERALLRVQRGEFGEAESYLKRTITPDHPDAPIALEALALGYAKTGRLTSLMECTDLWLSVEPGSSQALRWKGYVYEQFLDDRNALECYERAVAADPKNDDARLGLGQLLLHRLLRPQDALDQFEQVRQSRPDDPAVLIGLARCYREVGRPELAEPIVAALVAQQPRMAAALGERGKLALDAGRPGEAEDWLRKAVALAADDREALYNLIRCLETLGKDDEARTLEGRLRLLDGDLARLNKLLPAIGASPNDPDLRYEAGAIYLRYDKDEEGLRWLLSALELAPGHSPSRAALTDYYQRRGDRHPEAQPRPAEAGR